MNVALWRDFLTAVRLMNLSLPPYLLGFTLGVLAGIRGASDFFTQNAGLPRLDGLMTPFPQTVPNRKLIFFTHTVKTGCNGEESFEEYSQVSSGNFWVNRHALGGPTSLAL